MLCELLKKNVLLKGNNEMLNRKKKKDKQNDCLERLQP